MHVLLVGYAGREILSSAKFVSAGTLSLTARRYWIALWNVGISRRRGRPRETRRLTRNMCRREPECCREGRGRERGYCLYCRMWNNNGRTVKWCGEGRVAAFVPWRALVSNGVARFRRRKTTMTIRVYVCMLVHTHEYNRQSVSVFHIIYS